VVKPVRVKSIDSDIYYDPEEELFQRGIYYIWGEIESGTLLSICQDLMFKHVCLDRTEDALIIVNTCGGECGEAWQLIETMNYVRFDIRTCVMGWAFSAGASIVAAGTHGKRFAQPNAAMMIHGATDYLEGNDQEIEGKRRWLTHEKDRDIKFWVKNSNLNAAQVKQKLLNGFDVYMNTETMLKHGIVDKIGEPKKRQYKKAKK